MSHKALLAELIKAVVLDVIFTASAEASARKAAALVSVGIVLINSSLGVSLSKSS